MRLTFPRIMPFPTNHGAAVILGFELSPAHHGCQATSRAREIEKRTWYERDEKEDVGNFACWKREILRSGKSSEVSSNGEQKLILGWLRVGVV